jgi:leader peptidase (prepilin peptidase)/N-methyltransferase
LENFTPGMQIYVYVLAALAGMCVGSFLLCAVSRSLEHRSFLTGRSRCGACGHTLGPLELIPVFSYLFQKGRCRHCGAKIPVSCPLTELLGGAIFATAIAARGFTPGTIELLLLGVLLLWISICDAETMEIPNAAILAGIAVRLVFILLSGEILRTFLTSLLGGVSVSVPVLLLVLAYEKIKKVEAMGGGDIKLLFMAGLYFSWQLNLMAVIFACIIGIAAALILNHGKEDGAHRPFPFGPAIAAGVWTAAVVGEPLLGWYVSLF